MPNFFTRKQIIENGRRQLLDMQSIKRERDSLTLSVPCFFVQSKHKIGKNMNSAQQQCELTPPLESTHQELSPDWSHLQVLLDSSGFRSFPGLVKLAFRPMLRYALIGISIVVLPSLIL